MRTFTCACGARIFFDNTGCLSCGRELGFLPDLLDLRALDPDMSAGNELPATYLGGYTKCSNQIKFAICNWMVQKGEPTDLCVACRLNHVTPDMSVPTNQERWAEVEKAKRRLVYGLLRLRLPVKPKTEDAVIGLAFDMKVPTDTEPVMIGHEKGLITLNVAEADVITRETMRIAMRERYRTLLGHLRHEVGHYYWDRLIDNTPDLPRCRELFGDDQRDYDEALKAYYASTSPPDVPGSFISSYASAHPFEDWAETFAHYLHMQDTLETAQTFGLVSTLPARVSLVDISEFELLKSEWVEVTVVLNALNRSMGLLDAYPFAISEKVWEKIAFVHGILKANRSSQRPAPRMYA